MSEVLKLNELGMLNYGCRVPRKEDWESSQSTRRENQEKARGSVESVQKERERDRNNEPGVCPGQGGFCFAECF